MGKFRKKPVVVEAFRFGVDESPVWFDAKVASGDVVIKDSSRGYFLGLKYPVAQILTLEGAMTVSLGDYIIQGVQGELYSCKPDIFELTYEEVLDMDKEAGS